MYSVQRLERWWLQLFWQSHRQCMPVEAMAGVTEEEAVTMEAMLVADMLRLVMLRVDTLVSVVGVDVVTRWRGPRVETRGL